MVRNVPNEKVEPTYGPSSYAAPKICSSIEKDFTRASVDAVDVELDGSPSWIKGVEWFTWKLLVAFDNRSIGAYDIRIADQLIDGKNVLNIEGFLGGRSGAYAIYLVDPLNVDNAVISIKKSRSFDLNASYATKIHPNIYYKSNGWAWRFRNIFTYEGRAYILGGGDWNAKEFSVVKIGIPVQNMCEFSDAVIIDAKYPFLELLGDSLNRVSGCGHATACIGSGGDDFCKYDTGQYVENLLSQKQKPHLISKSVQIKYEKLFEKYALTDYENSDIWTKRFISSVRQMIPLAKLDLIDLFQKYYGLSIEDANFIANYHVYQLIKLSFGGAPSPYDFDQETPSEEDKGGVNQFSSATENVGVKGLFDKNKGLGVNSLVIDYIEFMSKGDIAELASKADWQYKNMLMYSAHMNHYGSASELLWFQPKVESTQLSDDLYCINVYTENRTPLTYAAENASKEMISFLVSSGMDINAKDSKGNGLDVYLQKNPYISKTARDRGMAFFADLKLRGNPIDVKPSFDCRKASTKTEIAICASKTLSNYDNSLATLYAQLKNHERYDEIKISQRQWLKNERNSCELENDRQDTSACLAKVYRDRNYLFYQILVSENNIGLR
ncbi:MAG: DUF1311 domain-containing protein [Caldisericia bacterium]|nr:DUF1311 domain-containing protein [Caldisericia bacterium]